MGILWGSLKAKESLASEVTTSYEGSAERALGGSKMPAPRHQNNPCSREGTGGEWDGQQDQALSRFGLQVQVRFQHSQVHPKESLHHGQGTEQTKRSCELCQSKAMIYMIRTTFYLYVNKG